MRLLITLVVALAVLMGLAVMFLGSRDVESVGPRALAREGAQPAGDEVLSPVTMPSAETDTRARVLPFALSEASVEPELVAADAARPEKRSEVVTIRGRFLFLDGTPAEGVRVAVLGWISNDEREKKYGSPADWVDPRGRSGRDGQFELSFDPPRAFQFVLEATLDGHAGVSWRWSELSQGEIVDVGDVPLAAGGVIEGRVVGTDGEPIRDLQWMMYAEPPDSSRAFGKVAHTPLHVIEPVDPKTGRFVLRNVPPGLTYLRSYGRVTGWVSGPTVTVVPGATMDVDYVYAGPDVSRRITVSTFTPRHVGPSNPDPSHVKLYGVGDTPRFATKSPRSAASFVFDDLDPGSYLVEIDDPRFELWRRDGVEPGSSVSARIRGSAALQLDVRDAETNEPVLHYSVSLRLRGHGRWPNEFDLHDGREPLDHGVVSGLMPGSYVLDVRAEGHPPAAIPIDGLAPGETRPVEIFLGNSIVIEGHVRGDASAVAGARIMLLVPAEVEDSADSPILRPGNGPSNAARHRKELRFAELVVSARDCAAYRDGATYVDACEEQSRSRWRVPSALSSSG